MYKNRARSFQFRFFAEFWITFVARSGNFSYVWLYISMGKQLPKDNITDQAAAN